MLLIYKIVVSNSRVRYVFAENRVRVRNYLDVANVLIEPIGSTANLTVRSYYFNVVSNSPVRYVCAENRIIVRDYLDMAKVFIEPIGSIANWTVRSYDFPDSSLLRF